MRDGRRTLATRVFSGQEMFALDELAKMFDLAIREDTVVGALTVATKTQTIALTPGQALASAGGRVVSLPAPPVKEGQRWFVPIDFVPRALGAGAGDAAGAAAAVTIDRGRRYPGAADHRAHRAAECADAGHARGDARDAAHGHAGSQPPARSIRR